MLNFLKLHFNSNIINFFYKILEIRILTTYSISSFKMEQPIDEIVTCNTVYSRLQVHKTTNRIISSIKWKTINCIEH